MHLRPHLGSSGNPEDPESVAHPPLRSSSYPFLSTTQPRFRPGTDRDDPAQPPLRQTTFPPDRTSIADHTMSSSSSAAFHHHDFQQQHTLDHSTTHRHYHPDQLSISSPSFQQDRQYYEIPPSFAHPQHQYPTHTTHPEQQRHLQQRRHAGSPPLLSSHYNGHDQDQDDNFVHNQNRNGHQHQNRLFSQTIDGHSAEQQQQQQQQLQQQQEQQQQQQQQHRHHLHNTPLRDQYDDDSSRPNHAYSQHTQLSPVYSSHPAAHNQYQSIQRQEQQQQRMQQMQQQLHPHQQQRRHTGSSPSHDQTQRQYYNNLEEHKHQHPQQQTLGSQAQDGHGPGVGLHNASSQQQRTHGPIGRGQDFGSTLSAQQLHSHQQPYRHQQQHQQQSQLQPHSNQPPYQHASIPSSSSPSSHSASPSYSTSLSSSASFSAQPYLPRSSSAFTSTSTHSPSPSASFQRHRARTLSSVSPYFSSSPKPSSSYPSEIPLTAHDSKAYVSSNSPQPSPEWSPRRKRGRANQFAGFGSGGSGGGGHKNGSSSGGGQLMPQATYHQRHSSQDAPMTMAAPTTSATRASMSTTIPTNPYVSSYSSSLPSDLWMGERLISKPSSTSSHTGDNALRSRPLERSEDHKWWSQQHFESATGTGSVGSRSGFGSGPGVAGGTRQDGISALDIPKTYGPNKRPLILSPTVGSDSFAPFSRAFPTTSFGSSLQPQQHVHHQHSHSHQSQQPQQGQQQHRHLAQSQERSLEAEVDGSRGNETQEQRAAQQQQLHQHGQNNNDSTTTVTSTATARETLSESAPRTNPSFSSPRRTVQTLPMPHFRGQLVQSQSGDSSYQRRFYSSTPPSIKSSGSITATANTTASSGMISAAGASGHSSSGMMTTGTTSSSTLTGRQTGSKSASPSPGSSMRKSASVKRLLQLTDASSSGNNPLSSAGGSQDASGIVSIQLGRLLISTRQHVKGILDSFIHPRSDGTSKDDINAVHPNLERVLLDLLNGMLQSHNAFAARDNISSQEQPMTFRPTLVRSLAHLQELLSPTPSSYPSSSTNSTHISNSTPVPTYALSSSLSSSPSSLLGSPSRSLSSSPSSSSLPLANRTSDDINAADSRRRHRIYSRHPPSRLSTSTSYHPEAMDTETDVESDTDLLLESGLAGGHTTTLNPDIRLCSSSTTPVASGTTTPASTTTTPLSIRGPVGASIGPANDLDGSTTAADLYRSTIEFLSLMTAFVSVVCWLMQTRLLDGGPSNRDPSTVTAAMEGIDMEQDGPESGRRDGCAQLREFLRLFDDLDNVLNPIKEALSQTHGSQQRWQEQRIDEQESDAKLDPMDSVGLFAWHYFLFASDRESPFEREAHAIDIPSLHLIHFDVLLNELYTTHILSMTAKEHQKDHGQFYTPPGVVDFMWKRTIIDRGRLLDQFVESMPSALSAPPSFSQQESLIPTALDPCLGVSTFLSCYVRLLIQEAERDHAETIWKSEAACTLLLTQICENVWGIELDGFAFWMARCGILVALMPLVQHVQSFSHHPHYHHHQHHIQRQQSYQQHQQYHQQYHQYQQQQQQRTQFPRLHLFRSDTLQLTVPDGTNPKTAWDRHCILQLRTPSHLQFDFIVTNPPYMIRKTGTFSAPDPEVYDWSILGASIATVASAAASAAPTGLSQGSSPAPKTKSKSSTKASKNTFEEDERLTPSTVDTGDDDSGSEATMTPGGGDRLSKGATESVLQSPRTKKLATQVRPTGSKGMMQAYGYFVWFAAQRIKPGKGVVCMITASQWLTLEFAVKLRAWLFENCLMDEFFQFEPYKVFSKVQTDSLIFKIRAIPPDLLPSTSSPMSSSPLPLGDHRTVFLRHTDHHKPLVGILQDYMAFSSAEEPQVARSSSLPFVVRSATATTNSNNDLNIMVSSKTREELAAVIMSPSVTPTITATATGKGDEATAPATYTYSFAPMMPASVLTTYMLALTQDLGAICSAGTKKMNRLRAVEPLLWHRGPNTNPVYGLVVRMEYARAMFGEEMTSRWFRPALYWNGKNSPEGPPTATIGAAGGGAASATTLAIPSKALHREGQFWQGRDRQRLSKKEGSPAESYCVPTSDPQRMYALCMVDKESVKVLRQQVEQKVEGSQALWNYLTDVRSHFQPGLASKRKVASGGKAQAVDDEGVAFCSTNQCGADVPEKIVHPINYGYFSKTQPRQRFFLDTDSLAVTNQCIYLTLNKLSSHYDAEQCPPLIYFLTLLNSTTLQFFVLHHCQYDQQGRMRLFRESMAKIPFQDRDVKNCPERIRYVAQLGACMVELKDMLYSVVAGWRLTGSHHSSNSGGVSQYGGAVGGGRRGSTGGLASIAPYPAVAAGAFSTAPPSTGGSSNQGLLDWIRKGGNSPPGLLSRVKDQVRRMLIAQQARHPRHPYQVPGSAASCTAGLGGIHVTKARPSSSAPSSSSSSSILHLNKPRGFNAGAMMGSGGGGATFFTDTDTDTNTFTDTDTDTDDTMDPWMTSRLKSNVSTGMIGRSIVQATDYQSQNQSQSGRGQSQHSLARILNMPGDDRETSMDENGTRTSSMTTDGPLTMPVPIPEGGSRDRRPSFRATVSGGFGHDEEFDEEESKKAAGSVPVSTAMETDLGELYRHTPAASATTFNNHHQQQQRQIGGVNSSFNDHQISHDSDRIVQAFERAVTMVEVVQWSVDQYGYMLYGIRPKFQKLLELELKIVYGSRLESLIAPSTPPPSAAAPGVGEDGRVVAASLGITVRDLYRWEGDCEPTPPPLTPAPGSGPASTTSSASSPPSKSAPGNNGGGQLLPTYALQVLENAQSATQLLRELFDQFPALPSSSSFTPSTM